MKLPWLTTEEDMKGTHKLSIVIVLFIFNGFPRCTYLY